MISCRGVQFQKIIDCPIPFTPLIKGAEEDLFALLIGNGVLHGLFINHFLILYVSKKWSDSYIIFIWSKQKSQRPPMAEQLKRIKWTITMKLCSLQSFTEQAGCAVVIGEGKHSTLNR